MCSIKNKTVLLGRQTPLLAEPPVEASVLPSETIAALFHLVIFPGQKSAAAMPSFSGKIIAAISQNVTGTNGHFRGSELDGG